MNSEVVDEDCETAARRRVLAPIGSALLGLRANQSIEWRVPGGTRRICVVEVTYQREAAGDLTR